MWRGKDPTAVAGEDKGKQSMGEKKARKIMGKLKEDARRLKRPWKEMEEEKNKEAAKMKRVREEVEKAPTYDDQPCQLTQTAVKISFPEEMRSEIFVNLLGYKEPNLLHLKRSES